MKNRMLFPVLIAVSCFVCAHAQIEEGRTSFSLNASATKYWGEYTSDMFGRGVDVRVRTDISPTFGLLLYSGASMAPFRMTSYDLQNRSSYYGGKGFGEFYPGTLTRIDSLNAIRFFHHEVMGVLHLVPTRSFVPQLYFGIGVTNHHATSAYDNSPLPRGMDARYSEWSTVIPVGAGFEVFLTDDISLTSSAIAHLSTSDNYDDLFVAGSSNDYLATFSAGIQMYVSGELDSDDDGLSDKEERRLGLMPTMNDTDGDSLSDYEEVAISHTDPKVSDSDRDGLSDGEEIRLKSSPLRSDSDADGLGDAEEVMRRTDPSDPDTDKDGIVDGDEVRRHGTDPKIADTDSDGLKDGVEMAKGTNPLMPDSDGDGVDDGREVQEYGSDPMRSDTDR
ncbi:MAG: hypothetical protein ACKOBV_08500, partial [Candidatus Kapaibacterium sp.]